MQNLLVANNRIDLHRRLGWLAAVWMIAMVVSGFLVTAVMVRSGNSPFFFQPLQFLMFDPMTISGFAGLTVAAILLRRHTEWHRRLHFCGMALLLGPAFGRLLPLPLLQPWAWEATFAASLLFPLMGVWADLRRSHRAHPAWWWGIGAMVTIFAMTQAITYSPIGTAIYGAVTRGTLGAEISPLGFAPPPTGPLRTGRPDSAQ